MAGKLQVARRKLAESLVGRARRTGRARDPGTRLIDDDDEPFELIWSAIIIHLDDAIQCRDHVSTIT
jgi:hypothetical protein